MAQVLQEPLVLRTYARLAVIRHGSNLLASLENKLSDSASLRYLRRRLQASARRSRGKSLLLQKAEKDSHECDCLFLAEQERFELSRRLPDLHP